MGIGYRSLWTYQKHLHHWVSYSLTQKLTISAYSNSRFSGIKEFLNIFDQRRSLNSINIALRFASTTDDFVPYFFWSSIEEQTPYPPSPIHVPVPTLIICIWNYFEFDGLKSLPQVGAQHLVACTALICTVFHLNIYEIYSSSRHEDQYTIQFTSTSLFPLQAAGLPSSLSS